MAACKDGQQEFRLPLLYVHASLPSRAKIYFLSPDSGLVFDLFDPQKVVEQCCTSSALGFKRYGSFCIHGVSDLTNSAGERPHDPHFRYLCSLLRVQTCECEALLVIPVLAEVSDISAI